MNRLPVYFVALASLADACLTDIGIRTSQIVEANPFMAFCYQNSHAAFYGVKLLLPLMLIALYPRIFRRTAMKAMIGGTSVLYGGVMLVHAWWILSYFFTLT